MYHNSGAIVKGLATFVVVLLMLAVVAGGVIFIVQTERIGLGLLIIFVGCLAAWLSGLMLAAFGELVQNSYKIMKILSENRANGMAARPRMEYAEIPMNNADVNVVMQRDNIPYADPVSVGQKDRMYGDNSYAEFNGGYSNVDPYANTATNSNAVPDTAPVSNPAVCPNCGSPRKGNSAFCGFCGTRLQ